MKVTHVVDLLSQHPEGSFLELASFNGRDFGTCSVTGVAPGWEMHPDTDEFFYIIEGTVEMTLLEGDAPPKLYTAPAGSAFVVPRGVWHKPGAPAGAKFLYHTPGKSLVSESDDPRTSDDAIEWTEE